MNDTIRHDKDGGFTVIPFKECIRINSDDSNRCINCGTKAGHKCEINNLPMDEFVKEQGFNSLKEFNKMVSGIDLSTNDKLKQFKYWKENDGTKIGLYKLK